MSDRLGRAIMRMGYAGFLAILSQGEKAFKPDFLHQVAGVTFIMGGVLYFAYWGWE